jgi:prepilin-type N-terminal cleavage/methylation domain-containing protein
MMLRHRRKFGFTLLELMIALGLLGALMAVAWALLGTFRDAEMRGWKLSYRTQTIRSARNWLEGDLQHLMIDVAPLQPAIATQSVSTTQATQSAFHGDGTGFSATISPSIDPIPFLGNLMSDVSDSEFGNSRDELAAGDELEEAVPSSLWPADFVEIEYELVPMEPTATASTGIANGLIDQTQYALVRREHVSISGGTSMQLPAERVLNVQDLYRQQGEDLLTKATPTKETRLEGLMRPEFRYFDGELWVKQWNSSQRGKMPRAIAFGFDFPAAKDLVRPSERVINLEAQSARSTESELSRDFTRNATDQVEDIASLRTAGDSQGIMISSTKEVQIVILIDGQTTPAALTYEPSISNAVQRGQPK